MIHAMGTLWASATATVSVLIQFYWDWSTDVYVHIHPVSESYASPMSEMLKFVYETFSSITYTS